MADGGSEFASTSSSAAFACLDTITSIKSGGNETPERPNSMRGSGGGADAGLATDILRVKALAIGFGAFAAIQN
jgi:hypothetical protein